MPRYAYHCDQCGYEYILFRSIASRVLDKCINCGRIAEYRPLLTAQHAPYIQSAWIDNHVLGNGTGAYDEGLGIDVRSRRQLNEILAEKGLTLASDYGGFSGPQSLKDPPKKTPDPSIMAEALEKAANMVKYNELPSPTPTPEQSRHLLDEGYNTV